MPDETNTGGAAPATDTPAPLDRTTGIQKASEDARARIKAGGTAIPTAPIDPATGAPQLRREDIGGKGGEFTAERGREPGSRSRRPAPAAGQPPVDDDQAAVGGEGREDVETPPAAAETPKPGEPVEEGAPPAEAREPAPGEGETPEGEEELEDENVVRIPGRREGEEFEIEVDEPETRERLRQLVNGFERGEQTRATLRVIEDRQEQLMAVEDEIQTDPGGFILRHLPDDEVRQHVALYLLSQPQIWEKVRAQVLTWDDPAVLNQARPQIELQRRDLRDQLHQEVTFRKQVQQNLRDVQFTISSLVPEGLDESRATQFYSDALRDIQVHAQQANLMTVPVESVPIILARRMEQYGIEPLAAARRAAMAHSEGRGETRRTVTARTRPPVAGSDTRTPARQPGQRTGEEMVASSRRKRTAAAIPGAGAGAPAITLRPPPNQSIEERAAWHRAQVKKRRPA